MFARCSLPALAMVALVGASCERPATPLLHGARAAAAHERGSPAVPILYVNDLRASQRHYRDALGFEVLWEDGAPPDFTAVKRDDTLLFLCQQCQGNPGAWLMVFVPDVDALHAELLQRGARVRMPPKDMPWHLREMHVVDVDNNVIRFGSEAR